MTTDSPVSAVLQIGEVAGIVWQVLSEKGPLSMAKLLKAVGKPRDTVMQALGWLAREDKISIDDKGRNRIVSFTNSPSGALVCRVWASATEGPLGAEFAARRMRMH